MDTFCGPLSVRINEFNCIADYLLDVLLGKLEFNL